MRLRESQDDTEYSTQAQMYCCHVEVVVQHKPHDTDVLDYHGLRAILS